MDRLSESGREMIVAEGYTFDEGILQGALKEVSEIFDELGLALPEKKLTRLIFLLYKFTLEHNEKGSTKEERVAAMRELSEK